MAACLAVFIASCLPAISLVRGVALRSGSAAWHDVIGEGGIRDSDVELHNVVQKVGFKIISFVDPFHFVEAEKGEVTDLPAKLSLGTLMAYAPAKPVNNELFVHLAGSTQNCSFYSQLLETIGAKMHALCVPYDNRNYIGYICLIFNDCYTKMRTQALDGSFKGVKGNNIEDRLVSALEYLAEHDSDTWGAFIDDSSHPRAPRWSSIRVAGHSQGAGNAAMIGYKRKVARVLQMGGICDHAQWPEAMAPPATPADRWFGWGHDTDNLCSPHGPMGKHWVAEGMLQEGERPLALHKMADISPGFVQEAHAVVSFIPPPANCSGHPSKDCSHDSLCGNVWGPEGSPYGPIWLSLAGV